MFARFFLRRESSAPTTKLRVQRPLHHGSLASRAPVVPSPAIAGADDASAAVLATHPRPSFADQSHKTFASKKIRGGGAPKKAHQPSVLCGARPRAERSALAFRRSTAALAKAVTPQLSSGPRFLESPSANGRTLPGASAASSSRTGHSAGRAGPRSRPGAECVVPPAGTALAPLSKAPSRRCPSRARYLPSKRYDDSCQMRSLHWAA
jgi:hypothetical protein